jgi:hypothetical protein
MRKCRASAISCTGAATRAPTCCSAWSAAPKSGQLAVAEAVLAAVRRKSLPGPDIGFAVAALGRVAGMVPGAGEAVFAVACTAGWIARALEAYAGGGPLRPLAVCTGPPVIIDHDAVAACYRFVT